MNMKNLLYYEQLRAVPAEAKKTIAAGRLKGFTDVNPMYRIKCMTQVFGACGIGWKYEIVKQWNERFGDEVKAFTNINLFVKIEGEWSEPIPGTGGATLVEIGRNGMYVNDEGYKMSLTDALSVAMKSLGVAADVYFEKDVKYETKYEPRSQQPVNTSQLSAHSNSPEAMDYDLACQRIKEARNREELTAVWNDCPKYHGNNDFLSRIQEKAKTLAA